MAVILALHGMNDSRDAWEYPAPELAAHRITVIAPDQRGFGETKDRGHWPGTQALVTDAQEMVTMVRQQYPRTRLILMGESMGAAVLMCLAASGRPLPVDGYILVAPAVWGRAEMGLFLRSFLWIATGLVPGLEVSGSIARRVASETGRPSADLRVTPDDHRDQSRCDSGPGRSDGRRAECGTQFPRPSNRPLWRQGSNGICPGNLSRMAGAPAGSHARLLSRKLSSAIA